MLFRCGPLVCLRLFYHLTCLDYINLNKMNEICLVLLRGSGDFTRKRYTIVHKGFAYYDIRSKHDVPSASTEGQIHQGLYLDTALRSQLKHRHAPLLHGFRSYDNSQVTYFTLSANLSLIQANGNVADSTSAEPKTRSFAGCQKTTTAACLAHRPMNT